MHINLIPVLLLGSLGIGKRCFESRNNSTNSNPFAGGFLISREISKVSFGLPEGFSVTAENGSSKVCFELLKTFRVTPENLAAGLPLRSRATCVLCIKIGEDMPNNKELFSEYKNVVKLGWAYRILQKI